MSCAAATPTSPLLVRPTTATRTTASHTSERLTPTHLPESFGRRGHVLRVGAETHLLQKMFPRIESSPPGSLPSAPRWEADSLSIRRHSRAGVSKDCVRRHSYGVDVDAGAKTGYQHSVVCRATGPELHSTGAAGRVPHTDGQSNGHTTQGNHAVRRRHRRSTPASGSRDFVHQYQTSSKRAARRFRWAARRTWSKACRETPRLSATSVALWVRGCSK